MTFPTRVSPAVPDQEPPYPVVDSARLDPVRRRLLRRPRREVGELPDQPPGTVLVFQTHRGYQQAPGDGPVLRSGVAAEASAVLVVSIEKQLVEAYVPLPSVDPKSAAALRVGYHCLVTDPVDVLTAGCFAIRPYLRRHLLDDDKLQMLSTRDDVGTNPEVARRILARVLARNGLETLHVTGLSAELAGVSLLLDAGWVPHPRPAGDDYDGYGRYDHLDADHADGFPDRRDLISPRDGYANPDDLEQ